MTGDPGTAQGVGKMFPGTLGGQARPAQPVTRPPPRPRRWTVLPTEPPLLYDNLGAFDYYHWFLQWPTVADDTDEPIVFYDVTGPGPAYVATGITWTDAPVYPARNTGPSSWHVPPATGVIVQLFFDFSEVPYGSPPASYNDPITRHLHLQLVRDSDSAVLVDETETYTGTRALTVGHMTRGPYHMPDAFTIYPYCNWGNVAVRATTHASNIVDPQLAIYVRGILL